MATKEKQRQGSKRNNLVMEPNGFQKSNFENVNRFSFQSGEEMVTTQSELESSTDLIIKNEETAQIKPCTVESKSLLCHMNIQGFSPVVTSAKDISACQSLLFKNPSVSSINVSCLPSATMVNGQMFDLVI